MKKLVLFTSAIIALAFSCAKEDQSPVAQQSKLTITASIDQTTKATISYNKILWATDDQIAVFNGTDFSEFTLASGNGTGDATFSGPSIEPSGVAVFPASIAKSYLGETTTVTLPNAYGYVAHGIPVPMLAKIHGGDVDNLAFSPLTGFIRFGYIRETNDGAKYFAVKTVNNKIHGDFEVTTDDEGKKVLKTSESVGEDNIVKVEISGNEDTFIVPLPVGTYSEIEVSLLDENEELIDNTTQTYYNETISRLDIIMASAGCSYSDGFTMEHTGLTIYKSSGKAVVRTKIIHSAPTTITSWSTAFVLKSTFEDTYNSNVAKYINAVKNNASIITNPSTTYVYNLTDGQEYVFIDYQLSEEGENRITTGEYIIMTLTAPTKEEKDQFYNEKLAEYNKWLGKWDVHATFSSGNSMELEILEDEPLVSFKLRGLCKNSFAAAYENSDMDLEYNTGGSVTLKTQTYQDRIFTNGDYINMYPQLVRYYNIGNKSYVTSGSGNSIFTMSLRNEDSEAYTTPAIVSSGGVDYPVLSFRIRYPRKHKDTGETSNGEYAAAPRITLDGMTWTRVTE